MAVKVVKKPVVGHVEVEQNKQVTQDEHPLVTQVDVSKVTASVGFSAAYTKSLGNYESLKIAVTLFLPVEVDPTKLHGNDKALDGAFMYVQSWVDKKVNDVLDELEKS